MDLLNEIKTTVTPLFARLQQAYDLAPVVLRLTHDIAEARRGNQAYLVQSSDEVLPSGFDAYIVPHHCIGNLTVQTRGDLPVYELPENLSHLEEHDVVRIVPRRGEIAVMYRRRSPTNSLLLTEQCNSRCVMCSQPPKKRQDTEVGDACLETIPLIDPATQELGLTGGEPTLLGRKFLEILRACKCHLPNTAIHVLTNGRAFNYLRYAQDVAEVAHPDCVLGIPIYSDLAWEHDFCVQAAGAFDQTIRGILNLGRCDIRIEVRIVIHSYSVVRLPQLAEFIARNLPFVEHVALMGLEPIGFGKTNLDSLWIDPLDYHEQLELAVRRLAEARMNVSIYNHQLCVLPSALWSFARQSISDWKNIYLPECATCAVQKECGGFFHSSTSLHSRGIKPLDVIARQEFCPAK